MNSQTSSGGKQRHGTFRIAEEVFAGIDQRADELATSRNQLIERYLTEGLRRDRHPQITFRDTATGRRPCIAGTRLDVAAIIATIRAENGSVSATAAYFHCSPAIVNAAVSYYAEYAAEVDALADRDALRAENAERLWQRERDLLAG